MSFINNKNGRAACPPVYDEYLKGYSYLFTTNCLVAVAPFPEMVRK